MKQVQQSAIYYCYGLARYVRLTADDVDMLSQESFLVLENILRMDAPISKQGEYFFVWDENCEQMKIFIDLGSRSDIFNVKRFVLAGSGEEVQGAFVAEVDIQRLHGLSARDIQKVVQESAFSFWNKCMKIVDKERATVLRGTHMHF